MKKDKVMKTFLEELEKIPNIQNVCSKCSISRNTFYRWRSEDPEFSEAVDKAMELGVQMINDYAESNVLSGLRNADPKYTMFWLKSKHPDYAPHTKKEIEKEKRLGLFDILQRELGRKPRP